MTDAPLHIEICICTYRRPQLAQTLRSLQDLIVPAGTRISVLVADNDSAPSARALVQTHGAALDPLYVHAPARNISIARNACLDNARGPLVAWIDDDETADPGWLLALYDAHRAGGLDAVFGPAIAIYPKDAPEHLRRGDFHSNRPVRRHGEVRTGHSCNALVDLRNPLLAAERFDLARGRTGGEDTAYFHRLWQLGARLGICAEAQVFEPVSPARLAPGWMIRRSFNAGHVHGELAARGAAMRLALGAGAALKVGYCLVLAVLTGPSAMRRLWWARRGAMHLGVIAGLLGIRPGAQY